HRPCRVLGRLPERNEIAAFDRVRLIRLISPTFRAVVAAMRILLLSFAMLLSACPAAPAVSDTPEPPSTTASEPSVTAAAPQLSVEFLREHTRTLSSDEFGGRLPASEG